MSLSTAVGRQSNLLDETPEHAHQLVISQPLLSNSELEKLRQVKHDVFQSDTVDCTWPVNEGVEGLAKAMERLCREASQYLADGDNILILSDRRAGKDRVPIPALLAVAGVHHHLVREGTRLQAGLVVESGEPREPHHIACLLGYGASAVNPYLAFETLHVMHDRGLLPNVQNAAEAERSMVKAMGKAILKTISKMGISTVRSYCGAQIFEAVGLEPDLIHRYFTGTTSRIGGIGLDVLAKEALTRHARAFPYSEERLPVGGVHAWRRDGEHHQWNPDTIATLQHAVRAGGAESYEEYSRLGHEGSSRKAPLYRRHRPGRAGQGGAHPPRARVPVQRGAPAGRRRARLAPRRRAPPVEPGHDRHAAARRARGRSGVVRGVLAARQRGLVAQGHALSAASAWTCWPRRRSPATRARSRTARSACRSAACTPGAATASTTSGTRTRSPRCSTPCARAERSRTRSTRGSSTRTRRARPRSIGGIGLDVLAKEALTRHARAFPYSEERLPVGGVHAWRRDGEHHQWNPDTIATLQHAVRAGGAESYEEYSRLVNEDSSRKAT